MDMKENSCEYQVKQLSINSGLFLTLTKIIYLFHYFSQFNSSTEDTIQGTIPVGADGKYMYI
jgi:hypothetical protein